MDPLSIIGGIATIVELSKFIVHFAKDVGNASQEREALLEEITQTANLCQSLGSFLAEGSNKDWAPTLAALRGTTGPVDRFKQLLESMKEALISSAKLRAKIGKAIKWPFEKSEMTNILTKLERFKTLCTLAIGRDHIGLSIAIRKDVQIMNREISSTNVQLDYIRQEVESTRHDIAKISIHEEDKNLRARLSSIDHMAVHADIRSRRASHTGQWFLNDPVFISWDQGPSSILWCPGIPGSGKTILSSLVLDTFARSTDEVIKVAGIYCTYKAPKSTLDLVGSLVLQLLEQQTEIPKTLNLLYKKTHINLGDLLNLLPEILALHSKIVFVVDALDECNDWESLLSILQNLLKSETGTIIHILITSRPIHEIEKKLSGSKHLTIRGNEIDMRTYLQQRLHDGSRLTTFIEKYPELENQIVEAVLENVDGMFLLTHLRIDMLAQKLSVRKLIAAFKNLPKALDDMYDEAVNRVQNQNEDQRHLAFRVLSWITHASRSLTIQELQHALAIEEDDTALDETGIIEPSDLTSFCAGLVILDEESDSITLVHQTTQEYFQRRKFSLFPEANLIIAKACINYLCLDVFKIEGFCATPDDFRRRVDKHSLFSYSTESWGVHAQAAPGDEICRKIATFLQHDSARCALTQAILWYRPRGFGGISGYPPKHGLNSFVDEKFELDMFLRASIQSSPLHIASFFGLTNVATLLIQQSAQVDDKDELGTTPLQWALLNGQFEMARFLLKRKANVNTITYGDIPNRWSLDFQGCFTPLTMASALGDVELMKLLLDAGAHVDELNTEKVAPSCSVLGAAVFHENYDAVKLLLNHGANVDKVLDYDFESIFEDKAILSLLVEAGLSKHKLCSFMSEAAQWGKDELLLYLLQCGVDVNGYGESVADGRTPLFAAASGFDSHDSLPTMRLLIKNGANVNRICQISPPKSGNKHYGPRGSFQTPLMMAAYRGDENAVEFLLQEGALAWLDVGENNNALSCTIQHSANYLKPEENVWHNDRSFDAIIIKMLMDHGARLEQCILEDQHRIRQVVADAICDSNLNDDDYLEKFGMIEDCDTIPQQNNVTDSCEGQKKVLIQPRPSNSWRTSEFLTLMNLNEKL